MNLDLKLEYIFTTKLMLFEPFFYILNKEYKVENKLELSESILNPSLIVFRRDKTYLLNKLNVAKLKDQSIQRD